MADKFRALLVTKDGDRQSVVVTELTDADLMNGDVDVAVEHSTVNYKDGLAITGKASIIRKFPLIPGIDLAGRVLSSEDPRFHAGDRVVLNGYGLGEVHHGGYAERARVKGDWLIRLPDNISTAQAMAIFPLPKPWRSAPLATPPCYACSRWRSKARRLIKAMCW
jgi:acrylyl-CoA reductase (NADPH)